MPSSFAAARPGDAVLLAAAGTATRRATLAGECEHLARGLDWSALADEMAARRLLALLGPRVVELTGGGAPELTARLEPALAAARRQGAFLGMISAQIVAALAAAGIASAPLKGAVLGERLYGDPGRRLPSDIDLLVSPEDLGAAVGVVRDLGYDAPRDPVDRDGLPTLHFAMPHGHGEWPPVELHWRIHWYERDFARERLLPPAPDPDWAPAPVDELCALLLFYARDGFIDLRLPTDIGAWWDRFGAAAPAGSLGDLAARYPQLGRAIKTSARVAEDVVGAPLAGLLGAPASPRLGERIALRVANPNPGPRSAAQLYADRGFLDGLMAPPGGRLAFARRQMLPSQEVLDKNASHVSRSGAEARSRAGRFFGILGRYAATLLGAVGRGRRRPRA